MNIVTVPDIAPPA